MVKTIGPSVWRAVLACLLVLQLGSCGSGDNAEPPAAMASLQGSVQREGDGAALAGATASVAGSATTATTATTTTDAAGNWTLQALTPGERVLLRVQAPGHAPVLRVLNVPAGNTALPTVYLQPEGVRQQVDPTQPATVTDAATGALLAVPANGWRRDDGGALTGPITVVLTAVQPAQDASRMPGDYTSTTSAGAVQPLESFGAVSVQVSDAAGRAVNLAPGFTAELRIPASSRATLPASVGLYALNESTGRWQAEGTATLAGNSTQQWYTASVTHLSWWNADQPLETVFVNGCVRDAQGAAAAGRNVVSNGLDYTGLAGAVSDAAGRFRVGIKRGGLAQITVLPAAAAGAPVPVAVGPATADITLTDCLTERTAGARAPVLLGQPADLVVLDGGTARFVAQVDGSAPLRYQWLRNGQAVPGATGPVLSFTARLSDTGAQLTLQVENAVGQVTSRVATLTVFSLGATPPAITTEPADLRVQPGAQASFVVQASGTAPLAYQWLRNGQEIIGATASTLSFTAASGDDGARFSVRVSNGLGSDTSRDALLNVGTPPVGVPTITANPVSLTVRIGATATFSVQASGSGPLLYRWQRNGVDVPGASGPTLSFTAAAGDNGARYTVIVSNTAGSVTSSSATLTVGALVASGTLDVGGDAAALSDGSFTPNATPNDVQPTGPLCFPLQPTTPCQSYFLLLAHERAPGSPAGIYEQLALSILSLTPAPGAAPGTQPVSVVVTFVQIKTAGGTVVGGVYELTCTAGESPCGDPAASGVVVDPVQRTITFTQVTLARSDDPTRTMTLNGSLRYD